MVDGLHNKRRKRKKGKKRRSVLKRLHEKQKEVAREEKSFTTRTAASRAETKN